MLDMGSPVERTPVRYTRLDRSEEQQILNTAVARAELRWQQPRKKAGLTMTTRWVLQDGAVVIACLSLIALVARPLSPHEGWPLETGGAEHDDHSTADEITVPDHLDAQVILAICIVLVTVTVFFERCKDALERSVPRLMAGVLQALFGELAVLGFISLTSFGLARFGVLAWLSVALYDNPTHLVHLFESVHVTFFFVMLLFLAQSLVLVLASLRHERWWLRVESLVSNKELTTGACACACVHVHVHVCMCMCAYACACAELCAGPGLRPFDDGGVV